MSCLPCRSCLSVNSLSFLPVPSSCLPCLCPSRSCPLSPIHSVPHTTPWARGTSTPLSCLCCPVRNATMVHADAGPVAAPFLPSLFPSGAPPSPNAPSLSIPCVPPTHTHHGHGRGHGHSSAPLASALFSSLIPPLPSPSRLSHSYPPSTPPPSKIIKPQSVLHFSNPFEISFPQDFSFPLSRFSSPPLSFPLPLRRSPPPLFGAAHPSSRFHSISSGAHPLAPLPNLVNVSDTIRRTSRPSSRIPPTTLRPHEPILRRPCHDLFRQSQRAELSLCRACPTLGHLLRACSFLRSAAVRSSTRRVARHPNPDHSVHCFANHVIPASISHQLQTTAPTKTLTVPLRCVRVYNFFFITRAGLDFIYNQHNILLSRIGSAFFAADFSRLHAITVFIFLNRPQHPPFPAIEVS